MVPVVGEVASVLLEAGSMSGEKINDALERHGERCPRGEVKICPGINSYAIYRSPCG